jgi:hypothetical protein
MEPVWRALESVDGQRQSTPLCRAGINNLKRLKKENKNAYDGSFGND